LPLTRGSKWSRLICDEGALCMSLPQYKHVNESRRYIAKRFFGLHQLLLVFFDITIHASFLLVAYYNPCFQSVGQSHGCRGM
jgi:hypothetical protein